MSRIGKMPIPLPPGVDVNIDTDQIAVTGKLGTLFQPIPPSVQVSAEDGSISVTRKDESRTARAQHGLVRTLIANMVTGVSQGYERYLDISGVGYRATLNGTDLTLSLGFSHPVEVKPREGISFEVGMDTNTRSPFIVVRGIDKQKVGQTAAELRALKKPEPYKGKGIRYRGEVIRRKAGKAGKAGGKG